MISEKFGVERVGEICRVDKGRGMRGGGGDMCAAAGKGVEEGGADGDVVAFGGEWGGGSGDNGVSIEIGVNGGHEHGAGSFGRVLQDGANKVVMIGGGVVEVLV